MKKKATLKLKTKRNYSIYERALPFSTPHSLRYSLTFSPNFVSVIANARALEVK